MRRPDASVEKRTRNKRKDTAKLPSMFPKSAAASARAKRHGPNGMEEVSHICKAKKVQHLAACLRHLAISMHLSALRVFVLHPGTTPLGNDLEWFKITRFYLNMCLNGVNIQWADSQGEIQKPLDQPLWCDRSYAMRPTAMAPHSLRDKMARIYFCESSRSISLSRATRLPCRKGDSKLYASKSSARLMPDGSIRSLLSRHKACSAAHKTGLPSDSPLKV